MRVNLHVVVIYMYLRILRLPRNTANLMQAFDFFFTKILTRMDVAGESVDGAFIKDMI